jgi:hypothetical protein
MLLWQAYAVLLLGVVAVAVGILLAWVRTLYQATLQQRAKLYLSLLLLVLWLLLVGMLPLLLLRL